MAMTIVKFSKQPAIILAALFWLQSGFSGGTDIQAISQIGLMNLKTPAENIFVSGQPDMNQLEALSRAGIQHIINLRPADEQEIDETVRATNLGMAYHNIPVDGMAGVTFENAEKLSAILKQIEGEPVLLHCSSGNRVGALITLGHYHKNHNIEAAILEGRRWGLTRLESAVRKKLEQPE